MFGGVTNIFNHQVKQGTRKNGFRVLVLVLLNNNYNNPLQDGPCPDLNSRDTLEALWKTLISIGIGLKKMYNVLTPKSIQFFKLNYICFVSLLLGFFLSYNSSLLNSLLFLNIYCKMFE